MVDSINALCHSMKYNCYAIKWFFYDPDQREDPTSNSEVRQNPDFGPAHSVVCLLCTHIAANTRSGLGKL